MLTINVPICHNYEQQQHIMDSDSDVPAVSAVQDLLLTLIVWMSFDNINLQGTRAETLHHHLVCLITLTVKENMSGMFHSCSC